MTSEMPIMDFWNMGLTPDLVERAEKELHEDPLTKKDALHELKKLIDAEEGFAPCLDEAFLVRFLRAKKYCVNRAFGTLKKYYAYKARYSGLVTDRNPCDVKPALEQDRILIAPKRNTNGGGVMMVFLGSFDLETSTAEELLSTALNCAEIGMETDASQVCGSSCIFDMRGMTLGKLRNFCSPTMLSLFLRGLQDCWPYRINGIHIVNEPSYFSFSYAMIKPLVTKKLTDRTYFHGSNLASLHNHIPKECLPEELGGYLGNKDFLNFRSEILKREPLMMKLNKYVYEGTLVEGRHHSSCEFEAKAHFNSNTNSTTTITY